MTDGNIPFVATIFFRATPSEYERMRSYWGGSRKTFSPVPTLKAWATNN